MAAGWLNVLKLVPWSDVLSNAPKVAEGAKKLWNTVGGGNPLASPPRAAERVPAASVLATSQQAELMERVATLEAATADLHQQMRASSELISTLAEQNAQLIARIEVGRKRLLTLSWLAGGALIVSIVAVVIALSR